MVTRQAVGGQAVAGLDLGSEPEAPDNNISAFIQREVKVILFEERDHATVMDATQELRQAISDQREHSRRK